MRTTPRSPLPSLALLAALGLLAGCSQTALVEDATGAGEVDPVRGQTILFVGTDPVTLETNLYQVQAVSLTEGAPPERASVVIDADDFEVTRLSDFAPGPESPLQDDGDVLLPSDAPLPVPDRLGERVAVLATGLDPETGESLGRVALLDLATGGQQVAPDLPGLRGVRFTWLGANLILETRDDASGLASLWSLDAFALADAEPMELQAEGHTTLGMLLPDSERLLALSSDGYGDTSVWEFDATTGSGTLAVQALPGGLGQLVGSPDQQLLAATRTDSETGRRSVFVTDRLGLTPSEWRPLSDPDQADCSSPVWNPTASSQGPYQLAYLCVNLSNGRPDVMLWEGSASPTPGTPPEMDTLTGGAQTSVPDGSMDGLVLRSRLRWDPTGSVLVFGASNQDDAFEDAPMTLLALHTDERRAVPIYDGDDGFADFAHFSGISEEPVLLVWDRSASGLQDSAGLHPIQLVSADPDGARVVRGVELGADLRVSYPLFLGGNTLLYP